LKEKNMNASSMPKKNSSSSTALLVIDVQQGMFCKSTPVYQAGEMLSNINLLIDRAHQRGVKVFFIQHCDERALVKGTPDWQLHPGPHRQDGDASVFKLKSNSFEKTSLDEQLRSSAVTHLVIAGMVTHGCVKNTCLGALPLGYQVTLAADAHSSYSKGASALVEEWNRKLSEQGVCVLPAGEIVFN
jgi:nicotinamidase-related amidase